MSGSIHTASFKRMVASHRLELVGGTTSQWLDAATFRSAFCMATASTAAEWAIEAQLPSGQAIQVATYDAGNLFAPTMPRYITTNAMCGLPIRFVSSVAQANPELWVIFKS